MHSISRSENALEYHTVGKQLGFDTFILILGLHRILWLKHKTAVKKRLSSGDSEKVGDTTPSKRRKSSDRTVVYEYIEYLYSSIIYPRNSLSPQKIEFVSFSSYCLDTFHKYKRYDCLRSKSLSPHHVRKHSSSSTQPQNPQVYIINHLFSTVTL